MEETVRSGPTPVRNDTPAPAVDRHVASIQVCGANNVAVLCRIQSWVIDPGFIRRGLAGAVESLPLA
jgi:hypothetical protein